MSRLRLVAAKLRFFLCSGLPVHTPSLWVEGMALFPFILHKTKSPANYLLRHERIHLQQQLEMGILPFYVWYIAEYILRRLHRTHYHAYMALAHEREAYVNDTDVNYLTNRRFWAWVKYL